MGRQEGGRNLYYQTQSLLQQLCLRLLQVYKLQPLNRPKITTTNQHHPLFASLQLEKLSRCTVPEPCARNRYPSRPGLTRGCSALGQANRIESPQIGILILPRCAGFAVRGLRWCIKAHSQRGEASLVRKTLGRPCDDPFPSCNQPSPLPCSRAALPSGK